jgi:hypothetical protein
MPTGRDATDWQSRMDQSISWLQGEFGDFQDIFDRIYTKKRKKAQDEYKRQQEDAYQLFSERLDRQAQLTDASLQVDASKQKMALEKLGKARGAKTCIMVMITEDDHLARGGGCTCDACLGAVVRLITAGLAAAMQDEPDHHDEVRH